MEPNADRPSDAQTGKAPKGNGNRSDDRAREWRSPLAIAVAGLLVFSALSGLSIWLLPFGVVNQVSVLLHTLLGLLFIVPLVWYLAQHWLHYWRKPMSHIVLLGYIGTAALLLCLISGVLLTFQSTFRVKISYAWDTVHIVTTFATLAFVLPHVLLIVVRELKARRAGAVTALVEAASRYGRGALATTLACLAVLAITSLAYRRPALRNEFPPDYSFRYGKDRPFAPSLARTVSGKALDERWLSGSRSCGTSGCHEQIVKEWESSAHRYSAMDTAFQKIQAAMAQQNGPESTRYCGGCHDPISLFAGTKNLFVEPEKLTSLHGYQEGVSCLDCHSIRKVDLKGNANYSIGQPARYMFEIEYDEKPAPTARFLRESGLEAQALSTVQPTDPEGD